MSKVIGGILTVVGLLMNIFLIFLFLNSSAYLEYNQDKITLLETGYIIPWLIALFLLIVGLVFIFASKEDPFVEY
ncbi:MAG: hypothetical protein HKN92_02260 [Chitinophagales bacterium]|nr:hypothetical protein [Chitinophagales bacterium]